MAKVMVSARRGATKRALLTARAARRYARFMSEPASGTGEGSSEDAKSEDAKKDASSEVVAFESARHDGAASGPKPRAGEASAPAEAPEKVSDGDSGAESAHEEAPRGDSGAEPADEKVSDGSSGAEMASEKVSDASQRVGEPSEKVSDASQPVEEPSEKVSDASQPVGEPSEKASEEPQPEEPAKAEEPPPPAPLEPPVIDAVNPDHGPLAGGTTVKVSGNGFVEGCVAHLDGVAARTTWESASRLVVEIPARDRKGIVELRVVNPDGQLAVYAEDFRYDAPPSIIGTEPAWLSAEGGAVLTVIGSDFTQGCRVSIDGALVPSSWVNAGRLEVVAKAHAAGAVDLVVENPDGQRATREGGVRFAAPPVIEALDPAGDLTVGGAAVRITGRAFESGAAVLFAGKPVEGVVFESETALVVNAPAHASVESVEVAVVNPTGLAHRLPRGFAYAKAPPRIAGVAPDHGPNAGGTALTVRGSDFDQGVAAYVCGIAAKVSWKSREEIEVIAPPVARDGLVDVRVVNPDDQACTIEKAFRYDAPLPPPVLERVMPATGSQVGGLEVALYGEDFAEGCTVRFGGVAAAAVKFLTGKELKATTPAYAGSGEVTVEVVNPDGAASALEAAFTFEARPAPEIVGITPTFGPATGGTKIVIEGKNFTKDAQVYLGREYPKDQVIKSATEIHVITAPRKQAGVVDVEVAIPGVPKAVMKNGFRYDAMPAPVITSISPNAGTPGGGTEMSISGKNFLKETIVLVDGKAPKTVKFVNATTLELKTPPGESGKMVDVVARNPDGKEAVQKRAFLYDPRYRG
jgi:hypothetical protein